MPERKEPVQQLAPEKVVTIRRPFQQGLSLVAQEEFEVVIRATGDQVRTDWGVPVTVQGLPDGTQYVQVIIEDVSLWFGDEHLDEAQLGRITFSVQPPQHAIVIQGNTCRFVVRAGLSNQHDTKPWGAAFWLRVLCFG